jgi:TolA-binding protein
VAVGGPAPDSAAKPAPAAKKATAQDSVSWYQAENLLGRLEQEYFTLGLVSQELERLQIVLEDLADIQLYPATAIKFSKENTLQLDKAAARLESRKKLLANRLDGLRQPLLDAVSIVRDLIYEDPQNDMFLLLQKQNVERVLELLAIKREVNAEWRECTWFLDQIRSIAGLPADRDTSGFRQGFEDDFFAVLSANLGFSAQQFYAKLNTLKDELMRTLTQADLVKLATIDFRRIRERYNQGQYVLVKQQLDLLIRRYDRKIPINGYRYFQAQTLQALGMYPEALEQYLSLEPGSKYTGPAELGILQCYFSQKKYPEIAARFRPDSLAGLTPAEKNERIYLAAQANYLQGEYETLVNITALTQKDAPRYYHILYVLGQSFLAKRDFETAQSTFTLVAQSRTQFPGDREIRFKAERALANIAVTLGNYDAALKRYFKLMEIPELFGDALFGISWCYIYQNDYYKAQVALKRLVNQLPEYPVGAEAILTLSMMKVRQAHEEWEKKQEVETDARRILGLRQRTEVKHRAGQLDSAAYRESARRLDSLRQEVEKIPVLNFESINQLYSEAAALVKMAVENYASGEYVEEKFTDERQRLSHRIRFLETAVTNRQPLDSAVQTVSGKARQDRQEAIREVQRRSRLYQLSLVLDRQNWEISYRDWYVREINERYRKLSTGPAVADSVLAREQQRLLKIKTDFVDALDRAHKDNLRFLLREFTALRTEPISDEQRAYVHYQLGELYRMFEDQQYTEAELEYNNQLNEYEKEKSLFQAGKIKLKPEEPVLPRLEYRKSVEILKEMVRQYPASEYTDASLYSLLFILNRQGKASQDRGVADSAAAFGHRLVANFPSSRYAPQTYLLLGEYYFEQNRLEDARLMYEAVLQYSTSQWFGEALYKLGWTYYRLSRPRKAISFFVYLLTEELSLSEQINLEFFTKSLLGKEAVDYIAISFAESDSLHDGLGLQKARRFVRQLKNDFIGSRVMHKLGDVYQEQQFGGLARKVYQEMFSLFPDYADLPKVKLSEAQAWEKDGDFDQANTIRVDLFKYFNRRGQWAQIISDPAALARGDNGLAAIQREFVATGS